MTKSQTILVTGSSGQLGQSIKTIAAGYPDYEFVFANRQQLDLSYETSITNFFEHQTFDVIINCAAYTAVDKAESEPELADQINHLAVQKLSKIAKQKNAKLIHISTDYVFNGKQYRPYLETDSIEPQSVYGQTKLSGEQAIQNTLKNNAVIIRASWVYSEYGNNFVKTMLRLGKERGEINVVSDQIGSPTYATDLAKVILKIIDSKGYQDKDKATEIYHHSNKGEISWYDFTKEIFKLAKIDCKVSPITTEQYPTPAKRPKNTLMSKDKIAEIFSVNILDWKKSLEACILLLKDKP